MKRLHLLFCLLLSSAVVTAQNTVPSQRLLAPIDTVAEILVELAIANSHHLKSAENVALSSKYNYSKSKTEWLDNISARGNLNEYTIDRKANNIVNQFPRYNFGVVIPLGIFVNSPKQAKVDYYNYQAREEDVKGIKSILRKSMLTLYQDYLMNLKMKNIQQQIVNDYKAISTGNETKFASGQMTLEAFAMSNLNYYNAVTKQANIDRDLEVAKVGIEEMIGLRLEDALFSIRAGHVKLQNTDLP